MDGWLLFLSSFVERIARRPHPLPLSPPLVPTLKILPLPLRRRSPHLWATLRPGSTDAAPPMDNRDAELAGASSSSALDEETLWRMNLRESESMESGPYPERPGDPDCAYYIRTGLCRFGITCRYNHPPNRKLAIAAARMKGGYPERVGQPECQYYLKTGMCKFGATCKFHHPRDKAGIAGRVQLNILGYPLRPNEMECAYYLRTGQCKFGNTCKFHHPQPSNAMVAVRGSAVYTPVQSSTTPGQQSYPGGLTNWPLSRAFIQSPRWQGPSSYTPMMLPQGLVHVPSWNTFPGQLGSVSSPGSPQQNSGTAQYYGSSQQSEPSTGAQGSFYRVGSQYALQRENVFPERPDQPECQFYMKTGDCKFGAVCRFHHPRERLIPVPNCGLSPLGLPLRPGEPLCIFYSRYGICKFGPNCKFDHPMAAPMGIFAYNLSTSSVDVPVVRRLLGSPSGPPMLALSSQGSAEAGNRRPQGLSLSLSEPRQLRTGDENIEVEGSRGGTTGSGAQVSSFS